MECGGEWQAGEAFEDLKGHYMINLFDDLRDVMNVTMLDDEDPEQVAYLGSVLTDDVPDLDMEGTGMEEAVQLICSRIPASERKVKFWVDEGNLSAFLNWKDGVEARVFSLPDWNFEHRAEQIRFLDEMDKEQTGISLWGLTGNHCLCLRAVRGWQR
jgi:hypothetical protein